MLKYLYALYKLPSEVRFVVRGATDIVRRKADPRLRFVATDVLPRHKHSGRQLDMILTYRTNDQLLRVFAKGRRARFYTSLEQHLYERGLNVPRLLGSIRRAELNIAVWEYVGGRPPSFHPSAVEHYHAIIRAVAKASLHHLPPAIHKTFAPRTLWLDQVHHELKSYADQLRHFPQVLCHHDIKRESLILTGDGVVSSSIGIAPRWAQPAVHSVSSPCSKMLSSARHFSVFMQIVCVCTRSMSYPKTSSLLPR